MRKFAFGACACLLLGSCGSDEGAGDSYEVRAAQDNYSLCLSDAAARLDDGRSEAAAIGDQVANACYPKFRELQIADGDDAREQYSREHAPPNAVAMYQQDLAQQTRLATQAVLTHRQRNE